MSGAKQAEPVSQGDSMFEEMKDQILANDTNTIGIVVALLVGFLTLVLLFIWTRRKSLGRDVLICGPCDSGKTTLLSQLVVGKPVETYTSMVQNSFPWEVEGKTNINLVDVPGHERIRGSIVDQFSSSARGIVYLVDSNNVSKQVRDVAEFLHSILSHKAISKNSPPVLVLCNKQDGGLAKGAQVIQTLLEKEIEKVRMTSSHQLEGLEGETSSAVFLGRQGKSFEFKDIASNVTFVEGTATEMDSLVGVREWLVKIA
eukprot:GFUD01015183.1.p1 GENE.GFUD01015183.1~~GFUD01015183.1.p1  ORF type:complete len:258 (-),score=94.38 GFUD01015183.1:119-892(-)